MSLDSILFGKFNEIKKQVFQTLIEIQTAGIFNTFLIFVLLVFLYFLSLFTIRLLVKRFSYLEEIRKPLKKIIFYFLFFLFWRQIPGGFASFLSSIGLFFLMLKLLKVMDFIIVDVLMMRHSRTEVLQIFRDIIKALIWAIIILIMLKSLFGFSVQDIAITSAVVTAALGFAFQDTLVNIIAGISIIIEKTFKIGDVIQLKSGELGMVIQINWRTTRIKNRKNQVVVLPNKELAQTELIHYNYYNQIARIFNVGVSYHNPPEYVKQNILNYLDTFPEVLKYPKPEVFLREFKDFSIEYEVRFFISDFANSLLIEDKIKTGIWYLFKRKDIEIPFPIRNVYLQQSPTSKKEEEQHLFFSTGENILHLLPSDSVIRLEEGSLEWIDLSTHKNIQRMEPGEYLQLTEEMKHAAQGKLLLTPSVEAKFHSVNDEERNGKDREKIQAQIKKWSQFVEKTLEAQKAREVDLKREGSFINHFLNFNFSSVKEKKTKT